MPNLVKMLEPLLEKLCSQRIVLASASARRHEILRKIGLKFEVIPSRFEENLDKTSFKHPQEYVLQNAKQKALEVARRLKAEDQADLVIGADTVVVHDDRIIEKPKGKDDAFQMLKRLSGCSHKVYSGVTLVRPKQAVFPPGRNGPKDLESDLIQFFEETTVTFGELTDDIIQGYISTGEPMDKAGAYGIQGIGGSLVKSIHGDFFNVVGLYDNFRYRTLYHLLGLRKQ